MNRHFYTCGEVVLQFPRMLLIVMTLLAVDTTPILAQSPLTHVPLIIRAQKIRQASRFPLHLYQVYRSSPEGVATPIPFQIDEINGIGDYILDHGTAANLRESNGIFDNLDELLVMGEDAGPVIPPQKWPKEKPKIVFEVRIRPTSSPEEKTKAIYVGIMNQDASPPSQTFQPLVKLNLTQGVVDTPNYQYHYDTHNYLLIKTIETPARPESHRIVDGSAFYLRGDMKYFLTFEGNHETVTSSLNAYKEGPLRVILRVPFVYKFLKLDFNLGMYSDISFYNNAIQIPAIIESPVEGQRFFNNGSGFFYGLHFQDDPQNLNIKSNLADYPPQSPSLLKKWSTSEPSPQNYWVSMTHPDWQVMALINISKSMAKNANHPFLFTRSKFQTQSNLDPSDPLLKNPVNFALYFDLTRFRKGLQELGIMLFMDREKSPVFSENVKNSPDLIYQVSRLNN